MYIVNNETEYIGKTLLTHNPFEYSNYSNDLNIPCCYIDSKKVFDLINDTGVATLNYIINNYQSRIDDGCSIYDLIEELLINNRRQIFDDYNIWINENGFPYSYSLYKEENDFSIGRFLNDSIVLAIYFEIHLWIIKLFYSYNSDSYSRVQLLLRLLNLPNTVSVTFIEYNREILETINNKTQSYDNNSSKLFEDVRTILLDLINDKLDSNNEYQITKHTPKLIKGNYYLFNKANSLMGIAYYQLLLNIAAIYDEYQKICKTPWCTNYVPSIGNQRYCDDCKDKEIYKLFKSRKYNNSDKGKVQRHKRYIEKKHKKN